MSVELETARVAYSGSGTTGPFSIPFYFLANSHIRAVKLSSSTETVLTLTTDYSLTGAGDEDGGTLTLVVALASGETLTITRNVPLTQETNWPIADPFPAASHEQAADKLTMIVQQIDDTLGRTLRQPVSDATALAELPIAASRASMALTFDASGQPLMADISETVLSFSPTTQAFDGDGTTVAFTLSGAPSSASALIVRIDGVVQTPITDYTVSGTTLTFTTAPATGTGNIVAQNFGIARELNTVDVDNVSGLGDSDGSSKVGFAQSGTGANAEPVQTSLRRIIAEAQFDSEAEFDAALEAAVLANGVDIGFGVRNIRIATDTIQSFVFGDINFSSNVDNSGLTIAIADGTSSPSPKFNLFRQDVFAGVGIVGQIGFEGKLDNGTTIMYAALRGVQIDPDNTDPKGGIRLYTVDGSSTLTERIALDEDGDLSLATGYVSAPNKVVGHSFGAATSNSTCLNLATAATSRSSLRVPHGTAPSSPVDGDVWTTSAGIYVQINSATVGPLVGQSSGDWTPIYLPTGTDFDSVTYDAITSGRYIKTGNQVTVTGLLRTDAITVGSASGSVYIGNLPFTVASGNKLYAPGSLSNVTGFAGDRPINCRATPGGTTIELYYRTAVNGDDAALAVADMGTGANANTLAFSCTYFTA